MGRDKTVTGFQNLPLSVHPRGNRVLFLAAKLDYSEKCHPAADFPATKSRDTSMPRTIRTALLAVSLALASAAAARAETVTVAGSGGMIPLLTILAEAYMKRNPHDFIRVSPTSLTQSGGVLAARTGAVDIGMSALPVPGNELDETTSAYHIADVPATVAVHNNVRIANLTSQQLCAIYAGRIKSWRQLGGHDAPITVLTRPESDSTKMAFRGGVACFKGLRETAEAVTMFKSNDMLNALQRTPDTIGIIDAIALDQSPGRAHPVRLDGRSPTAEEVAAGRWPVVKRYTLVIRNDRSRGVDRFMRFIRSREGSALIAKHKGVPVNFSYP